MLSLAILALPTLGFTKPQPWLLGFCDQRQPAFLADVDGDGKADLIRVNLGNEAFADVARSIEGQKCGDAQRAVNFGKNVILATTVGKFDEDNRTDILAIDKSGTLWVANGLATGVFTQPNPRGKLGAPIDDPAMAMLNAKTILVWSVCTGKGWRLPDKEPIQVPGGTVWIGSDKGQVLSQSKSKEIRILDSTNYRPIGSIGRGEIAATDGLMVIEGKPTEGGVTGSLPSPNPELPKAPTRYLAGDIDGNGTPDIVGMRYGKEAHTGNQVFVWRGITEGDPDPDHDGLTNDEEKALGTDPYNPDSDGDGLLDGWEVKGFRGMDMKAMGCSPLHADTICLISRAPAVKQERVDSELEHVKKFYADLGTPNPDGKKGMNFHPILLDPMGEAEAKDSWQANRGRYRPEKWRGVVHWMQITPGGGGQADQLGDGGGCGQDALWAVFVHEFGHQMGLSHEGFWPNGLCPTYPSLMSYAYSYSFEDDRNKIHYSNGALKNYVLRETDLDETIPLKYDQVKFLEKGPYKFRLKANGDTTLIDWNWNGVFGEKHVRADINYSYSTNAGVRDTVGKTTCAPYVFEHRGNAYVLYGEDKKLWVKRLIKPTVWDKPILVDDKGLNGDPVAISYGGKGYIIYQTVEGLVMKTFDGSRLGPVVKIDKPEYVPTLGIEDGNLILFLWNQADETVRYRLFDHSEFGREQFLDAKSGSPVGICSDTIAREVVVGITQNQPNKPRRWQVRRYKLVNKELKPTTWEWVEGENGGAAGTGRITLLFEKSKDAGPKGRIYFYCLGIVKPETPWACVYMAHQVADKSVRGGWMVKRYYDEWTQSKSAPSVCWYKDDFIYAYRWVDGGGGPTDNNLHIGYKGLGIQDEPMGDFDDIGYIRNFGIRNSILILAP